MLEKVLHQLQGEVRVRVTSAFPERVLNLCGARKIAFWEVKWVSPTEFTCRLNRRDWYRLRRAAKDLDCVLKLEKKAGVPFFLGRFRRRQVLLACLALCAAALFFGSFFIWDFTVEGNTTVPTEEILRALEENGITLGTFGFSVDAENLRNHVLLEIPELSWITVNVSGCRAYVQVRERVPKPELVSRRTPSNVVARRAGLILKMQALSGVKCALPGTTVEEGQILISGVEDTGTFGARVMSGMGNVTARTWYTLSAKMPLTVEQKSYTGEKHTRLALVFGTHRIKFFPNSSDSGADYDTISTKQKWSLFGLPLPVTTAQESRRYYTWQTVTRAPQAAEAEAEKILTDYLHTLVDPYGTVSSTLATSRRSGDTLTVTLRAECVETIGQTVPIYTDTNEPNGK